VENTLLKKKEKTTKSKLAHQLETEATSIPLYYSKTKTPSLLASIASMRLFSLTLLILISNSGVETWHIISDEASMLFHRSCYKTYTSRRNCGFFKVESTGSDHKPDTSQVPLLNEQIDDTFADIINTSHFNK
jgi:hypothetical protein